MSRPRREFVVLAALLVSLVAMAVDAMLPALSEMRQSLGVAEANDAQLVVSVLFLGLSISQIFFGPLSDGIGRKPAIGIGLGIFIVGSVLCGSAQNFEVMLLGRFLQGFGAAGPRVVTAAMVRDLYQGKDMASLMSVIYAVFILVPVFAPAIGQGVMALGGWRSIFVFLGAQGIVATLWIQLRQPETLARENRLPISARRIWQAIVETMRTRVSLGATLAAGMTYAAFIGYLNSTQQIFQDIYHVGSLFPLYFGLAASAIGIATLLNSKLVQRFGMYRLCRTALVCLTIIAGSAAGLIAVYGTPPLWLFLLLLCTVFGCVGILFGNMNAMAMEPLGHIAGTASSVIASVSTTIGVLLGALIGRAYDHNVLPLISGFAVLGAGALIAVWWANSGPDIQRPPGK